MRGKKASDVCISYIPILYLYFVSFDIYTCKCSTTIFFEAIAKQEKKNKKN